MYLPTTDREELYLKRCYELAKRADTAIKTNPAVGAILVYNDRIISEGWHQRYGGAHAEVHAIRQVSQEEQQLIPRSTLFVSLEPCVHFGKTPPCTDLIIKSKIPKVIIGTRDPNPAVATKGIQALRAHGIQVKVSRFSDHYEELIKKFKVNVLEKRPYILLKWAQNTGHIMGVEGRQFWLSNPYSKILAHKWRSEVDAILIGANTMRTDQPELNNRLFYGGSPIRIVLDPSLKSLHLIKTLSGNHPPILLVNDHRDENTEHIQFVKYKLHKNSLRGLIDILYRDFKISSILIEGGAFTLSQFIQADLWDKIHLIKTNKSIPPELQDRTIAAPSFSGRYISKLKLQDDFIRTYVPNETT